MPTFTVIRDGNVVEDAVFDVDPVVDTANPFGDYCVAKMDDRGGSKFGEYARGTRVDVVIDGDGTTLDIASGATVTTSGGTTDAYTVVNNAGTYENAGTVTASGGDIERFTGYVVERRETEQSGADVLEVEAYSFDQFLRRNNVTNSQLGNTITEALADIIQTDTPVTYDAGNVDVGDDQELTRTYQGEPVENVLRDLAFKSNNEDFGVNDSLEFFFRPREATHIDRGIDNTLWFNYDIPELGKETINEVEVWFDDGEESVIVDDGTDKLDLQDSLGLPDPGTQRAELNRPLLTDISDAEDEGRKYLEFRNATLSGTVTTFGLFDAEPGDTIDITIDPRGINEEFVIASTEYRWGVDETILTIVEKRGDVDDILAELNDSVQRQEMEGANRDAPKNRITTTNATALVDVTVNADGNTPTGVRFVNSGRNAVRDAWTGDAPPDITEVVVGDDGSGLSRSNTSLRNVTATASATEALPTSTSVEYTATVNESGVEELGLRASDGTLIARAVFDAPVSLAGDVVVTLDVSNDASVSRGVLTSTGQTAVRDVLADNTPAIPNEYAYGSSDTAVSEGDTALGNELVNVSLNEILIQDASTAGEWSTLTEGLSDTDPFAVSESGLALAQSCFFSEGEDFDRESGSSQQSDADYSGGAARGIQDNGAFLEYDFTNEYAIPDGDFGLFIRYQSFGSTEVTFSFDGTPLGTSTVSTSGALSHEDIVPPANLTQPGRIEPGEHTLRIEVTEPGTGNPFWVFDTVAPADARFTYNLDNTNDGSGGFLDGPELFPESFVGSFATATTRRDVTQANYILNANDTSGDFYVELANDGSTFTRVNNSSTGSVTFAGPERDVDTNVSLARYGSRTTATPQQGYLGQEIDDWQLFANPDATLVDSIGETVTRAVVAPNTSGVVGETIREAGLLSSGNLLTRHVLAEFSLLADQRLASSESTQVSGDN